MPAEPLSIAVVGDGVVGERTRRNLAAEHRLVPVDIGADVVVLATEVPQAPLAARFLHDGVHVVSTSGSVSDVRDLLDLDEDARGAGAALVVGAAVCPGMSGLLARHLAGGFATCDELHIAVHGTAGPACAREHHKALSGPAIGWHDDRWIDRPGGSGRELCWFPEPVGARDCYRAEIADPLLLQREFPTVERIAARTSATRRDRLTARLPMLSPPHAEGGIGALRVEVRGANADGGRATAVYGIAELIGTATAATAAAMACYLCDPGGRDGDRPVGVLTTGSADLPTATILRDVLGFGVRLQAFTGVPTALARR